MLVAICERLCTYLRICSSTKDNLFTYNDEKEGIGVIEVVDGK